MLCQILPGIPYGMNNLTEEQNEPKEGAGREWTEPALLIGCRIPLGCHEDVLELGSSVGAAFYAKGYESGPLK